MNISHLCFTSKHELSKQYVYVGDMDHEAKHFNVLKTVRLSNIFIP